MSTVSQKKKELLKSNEQFNFLNISRSVTSNKPKYVLGSKCILA